MPVPLRSAELDSLTQQIDYASTTIQYVGLASPGTTTTTPRWQIKRLTFDTSGRVTAVEFASGNADFLSKWTDRTSLSYS